MVNVFILKAVDRGFIGGVMVSVFVSKVIDRGFKTLTHPDEPTIYCFRDKNDNLPPMNP
jgi:hypothetical protein